VVPPNAEAEKILSPLLPFPSLLINVLLLHAKPCGLLFFWLLADYLPCYNNDYGGHDLKTGLLSFFDGGYVATEICIFLMK